MAIFSARNRTQKLSSTDTSSGAMRYSIASMECSVWPSGMCDKNGLVLARDPFGIKLLYYRIDRDRLYFGSEMRAVRAAMPDGAEIDPTSLNLFLRYRYTPSPYTILKGVRKLAPGTKLVRPERLMSGESVVQIQAHSFCAGKVARRGQRRITGALQTGDPAAAHQRCAGWLAFERRR